MLGDYGPVIPAHLHVDLDIRSHDHRSLTKASIASKASISVMCKLCSTSMGGCTRAKTVGVYRPVSLSTALVPIRLFDEWIAIGSQGTTVRVTLHFQSCDHESRTSCPNTVRVNSI